MTLQRLIITFKPEELAVHALYRSKDGHGPNGPRDPGARPPYDLFDGPLPGQSFEDWKRQVQGGYYTP